MPESAAEYERERASIVKWGLITSLGNRGVAALIPLLMVPLALSYLGAEKYGAWTAAMSLTALAGFADLGIGTGLMTRLGGLGSSAEDVLEKRRIVSCGYAMMAAIVLVLIAALVLVSQIFSWSVLLGVPNGRRDWVVELIVVTTLSSVLLNMLCSLVVRVQYGVGQQAISNIWQTLGAALSLLAAFGMTALGGGPNWFVAAAAFTPPVVAILNTVYFFGFNSKGRVLAPSCDLVQLALAKGLLVQGMRFFAVSLFMAVALQLDPWIVAVTGNLEEVPEYVIPARIFGTIGAVAVLVGTPLWPLHSRAVAIGDIAWIRSITLKLSLGLFLAVGVMGGLAIGFGPLILEYWLGGQISMNYELWFALALWWSMQTALGPFFMVQNGANVLFPQMVGYALLALIILPLKLWAGGALGLPAIVWAGVVGYAFLIVPACYYGYKTSIAVAVRNSKVRA